MKCFTRYMLPLVIAVCMFLGSYFYSRAAEDQEAGRQTTDYSACITECTSLASYLSTYFGDDFYYMGSYMPSKDSICLWVCKSPFQVYGDTSPTRISLRGDYLNLIFVSPDFSSYQKSRSYGAGVGVGTFFDPSTGFANFDVFHADTGELFFHQPSPFQRAVQAQDWTTVMTEIVMILPLSIVFLTSLLGLRKGLRFFLNLLHRA